MDIYILIEDSNAWLRGVYQDEEKAQKKKSELEKQDRKCTCFQYNLHMVKTDDAPKDHPATKILNLCRSLPGISLEDTDIGLWAEQALLKDREMREFVSCVWGMRNGQERLYGRRSFYEKAVDDAIYVLRPDLKDADEEHAAEEKT